MIWAFHGNLGDPADWDGVWHHLDDLDWRRVDLWKEAILPFDDWAATVNETAGLLDDEPVLMGYSLGARLAMHALVREDSPWKAAVLVSGHPGLPTEEARRQRQTQDEGWAERLRRDGWETFAEAWNAQPVLSGGPVSPRQMKVLHEHAGRLAEAFRVWSLGRQADLREPLRKVRVPQLWVTGSEDEKFTGLAGEVVAGNPRAEHRVIRGGGHRLPLQNPGELAECVRSFLDKSL